MYGLQYLLVFLTVFGRIKADLDPDFVEAFQATIKEVGEKCQETLKVSDNDIQDLMDHKLPTTHEGKCLIYCFHQHFHIQDPDGTPNEAGALKNAEIIKDMDPDLYSKVVDILRSCFATVKPDPDPCETAAQMADCGTRKAAKIGIDGALVE